MTLNGLIEVLNLEKLYYIEEDGFLMCDLENLEEISKIYKEYVKLRVMEV